MTLFLTSNTFQHYMALANTTPTAASPLEELISKAAARKQGDMPYAGDLTPTEAFDWLQAHNALLVDVRTLPEWQFTGVPDLSSSQGKLAMISWKTYPDFALNPRFGQQLASEAIDTDTPLFFLCRSGGRSHDAAVAMTALGYRHCFNISGGFEGEANSNGHRGIKQGWKANQLPWRQG